jgi:hypothetical protein
MPVAPAHVALAQLLWVTSWWGGFMPVRLGSWGEGEVCWRQCPRRGLASWRSDIAGLVRSLDEEHDDEILLGLPQSRVNAGGVGQVSVLWARIEGSAQQQWARKFRPLPSMALQEGSSSRRLLIWALEETVPWVDALALNRKLAYKFSAVQKWSDPDALVIPAPGTCLREGRTRPVPVRVSRLTDATFRREVFERHRGLKEPPDAQAWMK